ncbi:MAG: multicopper oxidase domain-containing protein, partial [Silicimonas sp.]|nr:multicopper oxidase domain-containing protein [Silicimonas sp.]
RIGNWVTVNGRGEWTKPAARGMRMRLRLINVANGRIFRLRFAGMRAAVVALDGQPVARPEAAEDIVLAPAQRADLIVDVVADEGGEAVILSRERDGDFAVASFPVEAGRAPRPEPFPALPPNAVPVPSTDEIAGAPVRELRMEGGAMGAMMSARADGAETDMRTLAGRGLVWALNGTAGMSEEPFAEIARGTVVRMALRNETAWPHGMHLHGHHFLEIDAGRAAALRDTTLVEPRETREIAFVADNPGDWLVHCHMLEHADGGMMTWIRVT